MQRTPKERWRMVEEEKARREARAQIEADRQRMVERHKSFVLTKGANEVAMAVVIFLTVAVLIWSDHAARKAASETPSASVSATVPTPRPAPTKALRAQTYPIKEADEN